MDIRVLRYFLATAREQNITRAAETLHIAQPSLSKQLMELEAELGKQLLIRGKRRITLTADGILLRKRAEEIVALLEKRNRKSPRQTRISAAPSPSAARRANASSKPRRPFISSIRKSAFPSTSVTLPTSPNDSITAVWISSSSSTDRTGPLTTPIPCPTPRIGACS